MREDDIDIRQVRHGISQAALAHNAKLSELQAELYEAYKKEIETAAAVAERKQFSQELYTTRKKLDVYRKKLDEAQTKLSYAQRVLAQRERELTEHEKQLVQARESLAGTERRLSALSESRLGGLQLRYWRWRSGRGQA